MGPRSVCIVQARAGSTRLPRKVLATIGGKTVLAHVLGRAAAIPGIDQVVCATVAGPDGDAVAAIADALMVPVFRGSEQDVLARYHGAAHAAGAEIVLRVTSDCPLIDPAVCGDVLRLRAERGADYAANNMPPAWPHGLDCEAFTIAALDQAAALARDPYEREHVTPWIRNNERLARANLAGPGGTPATWRWTLDYPEDLAFLEALAARLPPGAAFPAWRELAAILEEAPEIVAINAARRQR